MGVLAMLVAFEAAAQIPTEMPFSRTVFNPWDGFTAVIGDADNDSLPEFLGTRRDPAGNIVDWPAGAMGVSALFRSTGWRPTR